MRAGLRDYRTAFEAQRRLEGARRAAEIPDVLLLLEHPSVYTCGRRSTPGELPMGGEWYRGRGIEIVDTDRGGRVTHHGPGQLVAYPIVSLHPYGDDVHDYIRRMERVVVGALAAHGVEAGTVEGLTGVWTRGQRKIASIGVHVRRGLTTHGFAVNVNNDLEPFGWIVPCGIDRCRMSSVSREAGSEQDMEDFTDRVCEQFGRVYERRPVGVTVAELAGLVGGLEAFEGAETAVAAGVAGA